MTKTTRSGTWRTSSSRPTVPSRVPSLASGDSWAWANARWRSPSTGSPTARGGWCCRARPKTPCRPCRPSNTRHNAGLPRWVRPDAPAPMDQSPRLALLLARFYEVIDEDRDEGAMEAIRGRRSPRQGTDLPEVLGADFLDGRIDLGIEALWRLLK